jgi:precorrin-6B methylase 2
VCEAEDVDSHAGGITIELAILGDVVFAVAVDEDEVAGTRSG